MYNNNIEKMKTKILNALKTEYATLGLSEKAFDGVASFLVKTVGEEAGIDEAVKGDDVKGLLRAFQSESDSLRGKAAQLQKDFTAYKAAHPAEEGKADPAPLANEQYENRIAELEKKFREAEAKAQAMTLHNNIKSRLEQTCKDAPILKQVLKGFSLAENETEEQAVTRLTTEYNDTVREIRGEGYIPPMGSGLVSNSYKGGDFNDEVARLRAEGKIPKE